MRILRACIVKLREMWIAWCVRRELARTRLTQGQLAAWVRDAWTLPRAYCTTYPADPVKAQRTWRRAVAIYLARHRGWYVTETSPATKARLWCYSRRTSHRRTA